MRSSSGFSLLETPCLAILEGRKVKLRPVRCEGGFRAAGGSAGPARWRWRPRNGPVAGAQPAAAPRHPERAHGLRLGFNRLCHTAEVIGI